MMYEKKRIYILVKTYPTISEKYSELVCTAGVLEDVLGSAFILCRFIC